MRRPLLHTLYARCPDTTPRVTPLLGEEQTPMNDAAGVSAQLRLRHRDRRTVVQVFVS